jgi:hypothetical protein
VGLLGVFGLIAGGVLAELLMTSKATGESPPMVLWRWAQAAEKIDKFRHG